MITSRSFHLTEISSLPLSNNCYNTNNMITRVTFFSLIFAFIGLISCISTKMKHPFSLEPGKYKVTILYPNGDDKTFDMDYYEKKHMPMIAGFLGKNLIFYEIDKGISGRTPNDKLPFLAVGFFCVKDVAEYNKVIAANRDAIVSDFKNYTNIQPTIQISEVKQVVYNDSK